MKPSTVRDRRVQAVDDISKLLDESVDRLDSLDDSIVGEFGGIRESLDLQARFIFKVAYLLHEFRNRDDERIREELHLQLAGSREIAWLLGAFLDRDDV